MEGASSSGGLVSGWQMMVVMPPAAAGLAVLLAGLADENAHVDEARRDHCAPAIAHGDAVHRFQLAEMRADIADDAVLHENAAGFVPSGSGIDDAAMGEEQRGRGFFGHAETRV
jgi:hypothetical protein